MRTLFVICLSAASLALAAPVGAQGIIPLSVEVRGGAAFPTGDFDAETGVNYGIGAVFRAMPLIGLYATYERAEFGLEDAAGASDVDVVDDGFSFGGHFALPFGGLIGLGPWVRAGGVYHGLSVEDDDSDRELGFEVGAGLSFPLGLVVSVTPGVRYRRYSVDAFFGGESDVSYFVADLGLSLGF